MGDRLVAISDALDAPILALVSGRDVSSEASGAPCYRMAQGARITPLGAAPDSACCFPRVASPDLVAGVTLRARETTATTKTEASQPAANRIVGLLL